MDDFIPQRRPFQFSLRKLLLRTAGWSAYLGILRWKETWLQADVVFTVYLAALLAIRIEWGYGRGLRFVLYVTILAVVCFDTIFTDTRHGSGTGKLLNCNSYRGSRPNVLGTTCQRCCLGKGADCGNPALPGLGAAVGWALARHP